MTPLISAIALHALLGDPPRGEARVVVLDATTLLPGERHDPAARYREGHIPGARRFEIELFSDPEGGGLPHMVPSQGRFARLIGALGVDNDTHLVFYDQGGLVGAARGWWLAGLFGHDRAQVLDGGLPAWRAAGLPVETGEPAEPQARHFLPRLRAERLVGLGDMVALAQAQAQAHAHAQGQPGSSVVIDARSRGRFEGSAPEPRAGLPGGHIPGSRSLPFGELLAPDGRMLPPEALRRRFAEAGVSGGARPVTSCGSGLTASVLSLGLCVAGLPTGAMFDGSWTEWASHPELPRDQGPAA